MLHVDALLLVPLAVIASGCGPRAQAAQRLHCPKEEVTLTRIPERGSPRLVAKANGCGQVDHLVVHCLGASGTGGTASSCNTLWISEATEEASFATGCPKEQVNAQWVQPSLLVEACGQRMTYLPSLQGWVLNSSGVPPHSK
jgi:hypothetical protein